MEILLTLLVSLSTLLWVGCALLPWKLWSTGEFLDAGEVGDGDEDNSEITVLIPARNEAAVIQQTLQSVVRQGPSLKIILIDDSSKDATVEKALQLAIPNLRVVRSPPLPSGWSGKLWALEQGRQMITTSHTLLLDSDIHLAPGVIRALRGKMQQRHVPFISLMAAPCMKSGVEKLLMPAFVHFFKILYPFRRVNLPSSKIAAAAGGCVLMESRLLAQIGGFESIKSAVIDDCTLAARVKSQGFRVWLGLTHSAQSIRGYGDLREIWNMVARSAFAQLRYSVGRLVVCTLLMVLAFWLPVLTVVSSNMAARYLSLASLALMALTYVPILGFYHRSRAWALCLPLIAALFLAMTWTSAIRYWSGEQTRWKGRSYRRQEVA
jgi:hopene-associated glycosyltransferase HpnB